MKIAEIDEKSAFAGELSAQFEGMGNKIVKIVPFPVPAAQPIDADCDIVIIMKELRQQRQPGRISLFSFGNLQTLIQHAMR